VLRGLFNPSPSFSKAKRVKILSIDGGGIKGIIPGLILQNQEARLKNGKSLIDCFDMITGTFTGGIIVLMLNTRGKDSKPKYKASDIVELFIKLGKEVFQYSLWRKIRSGWGGRASNIQKRDLKSF